MGKNAIQPLEVIHTDKAINLLCLDDIVDEKGEKRLAGEEYQLLGPIVYFVIELTYFIPLFFRLNFFSFLFLVSWQPRIDTQKTQVVSQIIVAENHALKIHAKRKLVDRHGKDRALGDVWLMRKSVNFFFQSQSHQNSYEQKNNLNFTGPVHPHSLRGGGRSSQTSHPAGDHRVRFLALFFFFFSSFFFFLILFFFFLSFLSLAVCTFVP